MNVQTIAVPTDLGDESLVGMRVAAGLARQTGARLVVIHVLTSGDLGIEEPMRGSAPLKERTTTEAEQKLEAQVSAAADGVPSELVISWGDPVDEIRKLAEERHADMIVITGKHRSRVGKLLMGSQTQRLILETRRPVLVVPLERE